MQNITSSNLEMYVGSIGPDDNAISIQQTGNTEDCPLINNREETSSLHLVNQHHHMITLSGETNNDCTNNIVTNNNYSLSGNRLGSTFIIVTLILQIETPSDCNPNEIQESNDHYNNAADECDNLNQPNPTENQDDEQNVISSSLDEGVASINSTSNNDAVATTSTIEDTNTIEIIPNQEESNIPDYPPPAYSDNYPGSGPMTAYYYPQWYDAELDQQGMVVFPSVHNPDVQDNSLEGDQARLCSRSRLYDHIFLSCAIILVVLLLSFISMIIAASVSGPDKPNPTM
ncbi:MULTISPECIES: hypothetical protein [Candidatus Ichthyocystis]|uniref:Putative membrane protein n=1 Tax=Candidatus Ichthyocystis hellenicum TaxID=1561003 RepID=A0A0S4M1R1_9BURK|nr:MULTISPECIES: hypothetical protein [Ichthyocystis]CUT17184.1 putative membrane protein [Candidatus Ichthyocystis hellenicum]